MNSDTKRHIDAARQVLVGVVPNPTSQIDQITNALIYKFMDDMDQAAIKAGGEATFFAGDLEQYAWTRLMDSRVGNQERMNLYSEALIKFSTAKQLPELFRGIFRSAFLPYRSPETLGLFLKEIDYFDYSHSEELGNAYEYLLSIMSSQGDAGQFRTPRHIIDFIVDVVNPTKDDKILDPACGTGGFLVSSYKHILEQHDGKEDLNKKEKPLTPDQRKKLMENFEGYDIDPTMVRIAQVNMYLHQFKNPKIYQYNTLSSDERWNDKFDVILANPPFMSPKRGITPHNKFSIQSSRSEVLFVDYIMNHLRPNGRAGIIVPEGIIFQSGTAHKQLRKNLVDDGLYGVVSLPSGVFQPYSGVKTSILLFDNEIAKLSKDILFVKIENDGFDLGATKRPINKNDLPQALQELGAYQILIKTGKATTVFTERVRKENNQDTQTIHHDKFILAKKSFIAQSGDYNLSENRYKQNALSSNNKWPLVELGQVCEITSSKRVFQSEWQKSGIPFYRAREIVKLSAHGYVNNELFISEEMFDKYSKKYGAPKEGDLMVTGVGTLGICYLVKKSDKFYFKDGNIIWLRNFLENVNSKYIKYLFDSDLVKNQIRNFSVGGTVGTYTIINAKKTKIPLLSLEEQEQIVKELDGNAAIINGAKQIVANWKPKININAEWGKVKLEEVVEILDSKRKPITKSDRTSGQFPYYGATGILDFVSDYIFDERLVLLGEDGAKWGSGDQTSFIAEGKYWVNNHAHVLRPKKEKLEDVFLVTYLNQIDLSSHITGVTVPKLNQEKMRSIQIPLPPLEIQQQIVEKIEEERELVSSAKKLIKTYEDKTKSVLEKLYGHDY